jgi:GNAT superfamily N-acetyltransferase
MPDAVEVRPLDRSERAAWEPLWQGYLTFYNASIPTAATNKTWERFHDPAEPMFLLGGYVDGKLLGIVQYILHRSTWSIGGYCYLQDLFVAEQARGHGLGRALIEAVYEKGRAAGVTRVYWLTHQDNAVARALYDQVAENAGFIQYRKNV